MVNVMQEMSLKRATIYNAISKYGTLVVQLGITMILARVIAPEEHGVVSLISVILAFFNLFADFGLGITIIQHKDMESKTCNQLFTLSVFIGVGLVAAMCIIAYPVSLIYNNKEYLKLCPISSAVAFFSSINTVPNALLSRDKKFDVIAIRTIVCTTISGAIAIALAFQNLGAYALVIQSICSTAVLFVWNYSTYPLKIVRYKWKNIASILGKYSLFQILFNFLNYFTRNLDNLVIGAKFGETALGNYNKAYSLNLQPNMVFTSVITGVLHPFIRDYKNDHKTMNIKLISILKFLSVAGIFIMPICFWCADDIILIMFGSGWETAAICFKMLSICIWAQMLGSVAGSIFLGIERTDCTFTCGIINFALILGAILLGVTRNDLMILSLAVGVAYNIIFVTTYYVLIVRALRESFTKFLKNFVFDIGFAFCFMGITFLIPDFKVKTWVDMIIKVVIFFICYCLYLFFSKQISFFIDMLKRVFRVK